MGTSSVHRRKTIGGLPPNWTNLGSLKVLWWQSKYLKLLHKLIRRVSASANGQATFLTSYLFAFYLFWRRISLDRTEAGSQRHEPCVSVSCPVPFYPWLLQKVCLLVVITPQKGPFFSTRIARDSSTVLLRTRRTQGRKQTIIIFLETHDNGC
jgi:hypothetical protein